MIEDKRYERYQRQMLLQEIGETGQQKLMNAKVLVIGAGGLGCPVLQYLTAAGVGTIGIVDDDVVSLTNLHRQVLYTTTDIGQSKAKRAADVLKALNPEITINTYNVRLNNQNAISIVSCYDIVIDGTDNFSAKYMINDVCVLLNKPLVYGAVSKFEGQLAVFNCEFNGHSRSVNYRDLFPDPPADDEVLNCAEAGVLGVLPGIIGTMQASETIKLITGIGKPLINRLLTFNALNNQFYELELMPSSKTSSLIPKDEFEFQNYNYDFTCATNVIEISAIQFNELLTNKDVTFIDVRNSDEQPVITEFPHLKIPLSKIKETANNINSNAVITFCQSGKRSLQAANVLYDLLDNTKKIYSLKGGIIEWKKLQQKQ